MIAAIPLLLKSPLLWKAVAVGVVVILFGLFVNAVYEKGRKDQYMADQAEVNKLKAAAATELLNQTNKTRDAESRLAKLTNDVEVQRAKDAKNTSALLADNRKLAAAAGGLRDPGFRPGPSCDPAPSGDSPTVIVRPERTPTEGLLSAEATEFLLTLAAEADGVLDDLHACREESIRLRTVLNGLAELGR